MNNFQTFSTVNTSISNMQRISQYHARESIDKNDPHNDTISVTKERINDHESNLNKHKIYRYAGLFLCMTLGACVASIMNRE